MHIFQGNLTIDSIEVVARETKKFLFRVGDYKSLDGKTVLSDRLDFEPGQFVSLQFSDTAWRAYSVASHPSEGLLELVIRIVPGGLGSGILDEAKVGDDFVFKGPFGHFVLSKNTDANLIFLGTGTGIAPLRSMILEEMQSENPRDMKLFYGGRNRDDIAYLDEIKDWAPRDQLTCRFAFSREENSANLGEFGEKCRITKFLEEGDFDENSEFYICGNGDMVKSVQEILKEKGVDKARVFMERFN